MAIHGADGAGRAHPRIELKYNPHEGIEEPYLVLADGENGVAAAKDLATYISRAKSVDKGAAIRLIARGTVLGVFACSLAPETLLDATPTILGTRALTLAASSQLDIEVEAQALLDRLARIQESKMVLYLPPVTVNAVWAGQSAPVSGWARVGAVAASEFRRACREGLEAVDPCPRTRVRRYWRRCVHGFGHHLWCWNICPSSIMFPCQPARRSH